ncbi:unnamed protein product [Psylliodes chrysocephalus]|uniref:Uncharacterized protein n=1 Tax=Psylliodes chrysocephalus TaxID=3402493 RepID=A0A9P0CPT0_9CUCU|nr:unnamed protein product [Psylliodes chrysocephala]
MADEESGIPNFGVPGGKPLPTAEELLKALENMPLSEEDKKELRESIVRGGLAREAEKLIDQAAGTAGSSKSGEMVLLFVMISFVFLVLVFFGYKLYSSLMEKERRREEKKRQKQQKKKK